MRRAERTARVWPWLGGLLGAALLGSLRALGAAMSGHPVPPDEDSASAASTDGRNTR